MKGLIYNKDKIKDFSSVITPPNDVISEQSKEELQRNQYSFVKLIKPESYVKSKELLDKWQEEGILTQDDKEAIYVYSQTYQAKNQEFTRTGFMSLIKLEEFGKGVLPHEKILEKDLQDRISLITETKANFGVPFLLYDDEPKEIDNLIRSKINGEEPYFQFQENNIIHKLWKINNTTTIQKIVDQMLDKQCIVADGHHRYTSEVRVKATGIPGSEYGLMCFINSFNEGTVILPTNRVIFGLENLDISNSLTKLGEFFEIETIDDINQLVKKVSSTKILLDEETNLKNHVFGFHDNINKKSYFLTLKNKECLDNFFTGKSDVYKKLDVNILHKIIIEHVLNISEEEQTNREHIDFIKGNKEAISKEKEEDIQLILFVNPPLIREVFLTAQEGNVMPQKATYFYPKVYSGLVTYKFE